MKFGTVLFILHDVTEKLVGLGILLPDGSFTSPNIGEDLAVIAAVEESLKAHGVDVDEHLDKVIKALPLIATLVV